MGNTFFDVGAVDDLADGTSQLIEVDERLIVLVHAAGHFYALDDVCTHDGGPLSDGPVSVAAKTIACPRHGAKFSLVNGAALTMPAIRPTVAHETKIENNRVLIRLAD
jgi:3-phenylpropionate/trans-cinnamate dioxygenase ferredoxin subunit